ncbi:MAG: S1C family serine protease [Eubacterium sp.]
MNEFDNEQKNNGTYYTPPVNDNQQQNGSYHYSYNNGYNNSNQGYNQNSYTYNSDTPTGENPDQKPPKKKNSAVKAIIVVIVLCFLVAVGGIVAAIAGFSFNTSSEKSDISQSEEADDSAQVQTNDSEAVPTKDTEGKYTVAGVYKENVDSCVGITVYSQQANAYNYFYGYGQQGGNSSGSNEPSQSGEGSGILMLEANNKTYVLTCAHVISDADSFTVTLNDGSEYEAAMVGYDSQTDIGVLSIDKTGLNIAEFADSDQLVVGEQVVAIGCPGGLEFMNSTTSGYISALDRPISSTIGYDNNCIQIDAAINPGNSGGALFNMQGQVIGVNSSKIASTEYEGMGFAVPSSTAIATANSLIKVGYVEGRAKIGITYNAITNFNNSSAVIEALEEKGFKDAKGTMVIDSVDSSSDLANKDIKQYDMIVAVNGETLTSTDVMTSVLADSKPGDTITLSIARIENNEITVKEVECKLIESKG